MKLRNNIVLAYNSSNDPLVQGGFLQVLLHVTRQQPDLRLHLITYEQEDYPLTLAQQQQQTADWAAAGIIWHPLVWHSGRFKMLKKVYDLLAGFFLCLKLRVQLGARSLLGFGTIAGSFGLIISKLLGLRYYGYQYEPHSEFMLDCKVWSAHSFAYQSLHFMEKLTARHADILSTGTRHMIDRLRRENSPAHTYLLPSCVDEEKFQFSYEGRTRIRTRYGLNETQPVFLYLGKFGGIYYEQEIPNFFATLRLHMQGLSTGYSEPPHLLVVTPDEPAYVTELMQNAGLSATAYTITRSAFEEVPDYISAADFGLVAVPPTPAQRFRSPIKVGEYLCCGLPYITCRGVSEDDRVAEENNVGVAVNEFSTSEAERVAPSIAAFLREEDLSLRARCRQAGVAYRAFSQYLSVADAIFCKL